MATYVDRERGMISRDIFVDEDIYQREQERIFCKEWLFVGHESQIPKPGDYFSSRMGEEAVIMVRDRSNSVNVFLNSCRHRGMKVCRYDEGNTPIFTCPYHGWSYGLDGGLVGVPRMRDAYFDALPKSENGLLAARVHNYRGMIFATWNLAGPDFHAWLGDYGPFLDSMLDASDGSDHDDLEMLPGIQKWVVPCNWKFPAENSIGDHYHGPSHVSVEVVGIGPGGRGTTRHGEKTPVGPMTSFPATGHGGRGAPVALDIDPIAEYPFPFFQDQNVEAYFQECWTAYKRNKPGVRPSWLLHGGGNIFPNMNFHTRFPRTIMVAHPAGPMHTEMWRWYIVEKSMPDYVKKALRHYVLRYSGPGGLTEQDDMENWNYATIASKGAMARRLPYNMQQGLGRWKESDSPLRGARYTDYWISEGNAMSFYGRWQDLMDRDDA